MRGGLHPLSLPAPSPDRIPLGSAPFPVDNITMLGRRFTGERVEVDFEWESPGTPCYPVLLYDITVSSPQVEEVHSETFEVGGEGVWPCTLECCECT